MLKYDYLDKLREQYIEASGDIFKRKFELDFNNRMLQWYWERNKNVMILYKEVLKECGIISNVSSVVEIGKTVLDTSIDINTSTTLITPYKDSFIPNKKDKRIIINGELRFIDNQPIIANINRNSVLNERLLPVDYVITHNPYAPENIKFWERMHNTGKGISVGVFGDVNDKDYQSKIQMLKEFRSLLKENVREELITEDNNYVYLVATKKRKRG